MKEYVKLTHNDNNALKAEQGRLTARNLESLGNPLGSLLQHRDAKKVRGRRGWTRNDVHPPP